CRHGRGGARGREGGGPRAALRLGNRAPCLKQPPPKPCIRGSQLCAKTVECAATPMRPTPPGGSEADFTAALREFEGAIGKDWVFSADADVDLYRDAYS